MFHSLYWLWLSWVNGFPFAASCLSKGTGSWGRIPQALWGASLSLYQWALPLTLASLSCQSSIKWLGRQQFFLLSNFLHICREQMTIIDIIAVGCIGMNHWVGHCKDHWPQVIVVMGIIEDIDFGLHQCFLNCGARTISDQRATSNGLLGDT